MIVRAAEDRDADAIWKIIEPVIRAGETYVLPRDMSRADALAYWHAGDRETLVAEDAGEIVGTYYLRANQKGGGAHVANCGYMTALGRRPGRRARHVRAFTSSCEGARLSRDAVQLRGGDERAGGAAVAIARI